MADLEARYGERVDVQWRSHVLRPTPKARTLDRFREYTTLWIGTGRSRRVRTALRVPHVGRRSAADATASRPRSPPRSCAELDPSPIAATSASALFRAYFTEHRTISEVDVLAAIAAECGVDAATFRDAMQARGAELTDRVLAEHDEGFELGAHAAPTVVINDTLPIPGAQDLDTYTRILDRMLRVPRPHRPRRTG